MQSPGETVPFLDPYPGRSGILSWIFSTDHKRIGMLYLWSILIMFAVGVVLGVLMRLELIAPGRDIMDAQTYNAMFTLHGVVMIFLFVIPGIPAAFGNILLPLQIGAEDVSFPRLNIFSWWLYMAGACLAVTSLFTGGGPPDTGWTFYVPFSERTTTNVSLAVVAVFILGFSSILTGLNFITTIHRLRAPQMSWGKLPLFTWSLYATAWIQLLATPVLGITVALVFIERLLGIGLFDPSKGGDPLLYQHLFWIYSHPAVYIMIVPAMGVVSEIIPAFARKSIFGYKAIAISSLAIAFAGSLVWAHHMFTSGMSDTAVMVFSFLTFVVAIPSAIKVFNWVATLYKGSIYLEPPLMFALGFIFLFSAGGLTGLVLGSAGTDIHVHDTYFVVAHFHYVIFGGTGFGLFAAMHFWFPKIFGRMYDRRMANLSWYLLIGGFNMLYFPMFVIGLQGMPRRYYDYLPMYQTGQMVSTIGSWVLVAGLIVMFYGLSKCLYGPRTVGNNPWGAATLEWTLPSPPPHLTFLDPPDVQRGPYSYEGCSAMSEAHKDYAGDKFGMWLFLFTEILLFGGLFLLYSVYLHRYPAEFHEGGLQLSRVFGTLNTVVLITSSLTVALAISALQQGRRTLCLWLLTATIALAGVFMVNKFFEWSAKIGHGIYPGSPEMAAGSGGANIFFGLYYVMTGAHGLHVIIGAAILGFCMLRIRQGRVTADDFGLLENGGLYWHLVDLVWIFLFPLFYLIS